MLALGKLSKALETVERARGCLYDFHQMSGLADSRARGGDRGAQGRGPSPTQPSELDRELLGRNVLHGRWTFQVVDEYDDGYYKEWVPDLDAGRPRGARGESGTRTRRL